MPMEISLTREGKFNAAQSIQNTPFKCGAMRSKQYQYRVTIEALDVRLSPQGFLLNNELVQEYFDWTFGPHAHKWQAISCENMARKAAKDILDQLLSEAIAVICVTVSLKGSNGAWISAKCKPQDGTELSGQRTMDTSTWGYD